MNFRSTPIDAGQSHQRFNLLRLNGVLAGWLDQGFDPVLEPGSNQAHFDRLNLKFDRLNLKFARPKCSVWFPREFGEPKRLTAV